MQQLPYPNVPFHARQTTGHGYVPVLSEQPDNRNRLHICPLSASWRQNPETVTHHKASQHKSRSELV